MFSFHTADLTVHEATKKQPLRAYTFTPFSYKRFQLLNLLTIFIGPEDPDPKQLF